MNTMTISASELRQGDLLRVNKSSIYVVIAQTESLPGEIVITIYDGDKPNPDGATLFYHPDRQVELSMRNCVLITDPATDRSWFVSDTTMVEA